MELREGAQQPARSQTLGSTKKVGKTRGKKKLPVPDLDAIDDPEERRRQRRLVKNRNTAAASRQAPISASQCNSEHLVLSRQGEMKGREGKSG